MNNPGKAISILVVDDEESMRALLEVMLRRKGYDVSLAESGKSAQKMVARTTYDLVLCDIRLGDITGLDVLKSVKKKSASTVAIMISAYASTELAVEAMNLGAYDYVPKPFQTEELLDTIAKALEIQDNQREHVADETTDLHLHFGLIIGKSPRMQHIYDLIRQVAGTRTNILITGESGTGKELVAKALHKESLRSKNPFVAINCGGIPDTLLESELFGHKKGSFTGAIQEKKGLFEIANGGTVFLDEIGDLGLHIQVKLLRAIQERRIRPVGGNEDIDVDIRIVSATNKNLEEEVINDCFREDLFYRLNVIELKVPPLRERKADLKLLCQFFLEKKAAEMGREISKISSYAIELLKRYDFPGNVRELENLIERSIALSSTNIILPESLALAVHKKRWIEGVKDKRFDLDDVSKGVSLDNILADIEGAYLKQALDVSQDNKQRAADLLGITLRSLRYRLGKLGGEMNESHS